MNHNCLVFSIVKHFGGIPIVGFVLFSILFSACHHKVILSEYDSQEQIEVNTYFGRYCLFREHNYMCHDLIVSDTIHTKAEQYLKLSLERLPIKMVSEKLVNEYSTEIWLHGEQDAFFNHNEIDTNFLIKHVNSDNKTVLVPVFHIFEWYSRTTRLGNEYLYKVRFPISIIVLKNNKIIYSKYSQGRSKRLRFIHFEELGEFVSIMNIHELVDMEKMIDKSIKKAMKPYLDRLK
jgi:hypothetical protein